MVVFLLLTCAAPEAAQVILDESIKCDIVESGQICVSARSFSGEQFMPNIEIHGMGNAGSDNTRLKVQAAMEGVNYDEDVVMTVVPDFAEDLEGNSRPFLRVIFAEHDPVGIYDDCLKRLAALDMDIEVVLIQRFIQKTAG